MASTGLDRPSAADIRSIHHDMKSEKHSMDETPIAYGVDDAARAPSLHSDDSNKPLFDSTHRKLKPRHIQLIGIGGCVEKVAKFLRNRDAEELLCRIGQLEQRSMCR